MAEQLRRDLRGDRCDATALLVAAGMLEAGVTDALCPDVDDEPDPVPLLRALTLDLAHAARGGGASAERIEEAVRRVDALLAEPLPATVMVSEPEGFAFYALYPEAYAAATRAFLNAAAPRRATVVGLRSIGTTLAAVVAAELEAAGVPVRGLTIRPRGHPFDREVRLARSLRLALEEGSSGHVLLVDEGPGISGSSLASAAAAAERAGASDDRIVLFPSWPTDGTALRSEAARRRWRRHACWTGSFEDTHMAAGRLARSWSGGVLRDLSGGQWRDLVCRPGHRPAVQPQHERRKYLLETDEGPLLLKFVGLGARGDRVLRRAQAQTDAGLAPPVMGLRDGFLALRWVDAAPFALEAKPRVPTQGTTAPLVAMGRYLGHLATGSPQGPVRFDDILAMTRTNVAEGLGDLDAGRTAWMEKMRDGVESRPAVAVDGRMLPQEWLREHGTGRILKCDGLDHHDDHFWPGCQDIAWDLAGAMIEWGMGPEDREHLLSEYERRTTVGSGGRDSAACRVLPFYEVAYLAWRLGYTTLAASTLGAGEDGLRMARDRDRYATLLRRVLDQRAGG